MGKNQKWFKELTAYLSTAYSFEATGKQSLKTEYFLILFVRCISACACRGEPFWHILRILANLLAIVYHSNCASISSNVRDYFRSVSCSVPAIVWHFARTDRSCKVFPTANCTQAKICPFCIRSADIRKSPTRPKNRHSTNGTVRTDILQLLHCSKARAHLAFYTARSRTIRLMLRFANTSALSTMALCISARHTRWIYYHCESNWYDEFGACLRMCVCMCVHLVSVPSNQYMQASQRIIATRCKLTTRTKVDVHAKHQASDRLHCNVFSKWQYQE